ncbi:hypothetical protein [Mesoterricola silvestris]|uniref:Uncharacterized protein n=1 Tax=Mesoterricola silvestris TaxID=2927979 RepID=A0AA48GS06_9BACT|nr:hypothetical protein [Mesoterricola silvestris]BDU72947.1 hypothetical protein METEAL_21210 [Mesoterricola silvestris]
MDQESPKPATVSIPQGMAARIERAGVYLQAMGWLALHGKLTEENLATIDLTLKDLQRRLFIARVGSRIKVNVLLFKGAREASPRTLTPAGPVCPAIKEA